MSDIPRRTPDPALITKRYAAERRFKFYGAAALGLTAIFLAFLLADIAVKAWPAFFESRIALTATIDPARVDASNVAGGDFEGIVKDAFRALLPDVTERADKKKLVKLISAAASEELRGKVLADPSLIGKDVTFSALMSDDADLYYKQIGETDAKQASWLDALKAKGLVSRSFAWELFTGGDSREPETSGLRGAITGSLFVVFVAIALSLPLGVAAAVYLEEFAPKNRWTDLIEVNINNLAAVPSIIFGLLGLAVFLNFFGLPRSASYVGGLVLALLVLPTIIISARAALKAVPPSIKEAALGVGASSQQAVFQHVLPLALPGILTGTILGIARALGETAPLLMIGMVAFIADVPKSLSDPATVLPVQIYLWSDLPELAFRSRTSAAIIVLLVVLFLLNALAIYLRKRFERRW